MKILFIHGLESTPETSSSAKAIKEAFPQYKIKVPHYYPNVIPYTSIIENLKSYENYDVAIGISLGGFWALHMTEFTNIRNVILLNPAIERGQERYGIKLNTPADVGGAMFLNMDDDVVDNKWNKENYKNKFLVHSYDVGGHRMSNMNLVLPHIDVILDHFEHNFI